MSEDSSCSLDGKSDYSSSFRNDSFCFEGYVNGPEYSKADLDSMNFKNVNDGSESESSSEEKVDSSRLGNIHSYTFQECSMIPSLLKSRCCREISLLTEQHPPVLKRF